MAVSLDDLNTGANKAANLTRIVQPVFFTASRTNEGTWFDKKYYEAVPCEDVFGEMVNYTWSLYQILQANGPWLCPKGLGSYNILNHGNEAIYLALESCELASTHLGLGDPSTDCETDLTVVNKYIDGLMGVRTKYIAQYFNIDNYLEYGTVLDYIGLQENYFLVWTVKAATLTYSVLQTEINVYSSRFFDLSSLSFFNFGDSFITYAVESPPS